MFELTALRPLVFAVAPIARVAGVMGQPSASQLVGNGFIGWLDWMAAYRLPEDSISCTTGSNSKLPIPAAVGTFTLKRLGI